MNMIATGALEDSIRALRDAATSVANAVREIEYWRRRPVNAAHAKQLLNFVCQLLADSIASSPLARELLEQAIAQANRWDALNAEVLRG